MRYFLAGFAVCLCLVVVCFCALLVIETIPESGWDIIPNGSYNEQMLQERLDYESHLERTLEECWATQANGAEVQW